MYQMYQDMVRGDDVDYDVPDYSLRTEQVLEHSTYRFKKVLFTIVHEEIFLERGCDVTMDLCIKVMMTMRDD